MTSTTLRFLADPGPTGQHGYVPTGLVVRWMDEAASTVARQWSRGAIHTAFVGCVRMVRPIVQGSMVEVEARLAATSGDAMHIYVEVRVDALPEGAAVPVLHNVLLCLAVDAEGLPRPVDHWSPATPGDMALAQRVQAQLTAMQATLPQEP